MQLPQTFTRDGETKVAHLPREAVRLKADGWKPVEAAIAAGEITEPPRTGAGSGRDAWETYATQVGVEVDEDMGRDEIIAAVDAQLPSDPSE